MQCICHYSALAYFFNTRIFEIRNDCFQGNSIYVDFIIASSHCDELSSSRNQKTFIFLTHKKVTANFFPLQKMIRRSLSMQATSVPIAQTDMKRSVSSLNDYGESSSKDGREGAVCDRSQYSTAGLFICKASDKPLPLTSQRCVPLPSLPRFLRLSTSSYKSPKAAPDILRRTGSTSSTFSHESTYSDQTSDAGKFINR